MKYRLTILVSITMLAISGCNSGASTGFNGGSAVWTVPGIGSRFIDRSFNGIDTIFDTLVVVWQGSIDGRLNAVGLREGDTSQETQYLAYEPNGDLAVRDSSSSRVQWGVYPTGGGTRIDSTIDTSNGTRYADYAITQNLGTEEITVAAGTFSAIKINQSQHSVESVGGKIIRDTSYNPPMNIWFIPSIGWLGKSQDAELFKYQLN